MRRQTLAAAAVVALLSASQARAGDDTRAFHVLAYEIELRPDFGAKTVSGVERIRFVSLADGLSMVSFSANSLAVTASSRDAILPNETVDGRRLIHLGKPLRKGGEETLTLSFKGPAPKGLVFGDDTVYANYFTCDAVICDEDRPGDKAPVDMRVIVPTGMEVVAPGRLLGRERHHETVTWRWHEPRPTSPHLIGFAAGRFARTALPGRNPGLVVLAGARAEQAAAMFADTRRTLEFFEEKSGVRYDAAAYTQVLVVGDEAQEAARHSIIGAEEIGAVPKDPTEDWVIAHELSHQWWGNSLTCADWSELWLNEGFAVFMTAAWKEHRWGRAAYDHEIELANKRWAKAKEKGFDVPLSWKGKYPSLGLKRAMAYGKSVVFLDKLRTDFGDKVFWRAIKSYTRAHKNSVVTAIDLQKAFEAATNRNLSALFAEWVFGGEKQEN
ncbi:MAG: M1 family peptidase [Alphaproteobacteria bacterium]|nr:M1 family peptidase [Alphaproteobacteria bacterium]